MEKKKDSFEGKPAMGAKEVKEELEEKYKIRNNYKTVWYGRQRV